MVWYKGRDWLWPIPTLTPKLRSHMNDIVKKKISKRRAKVIGLDTKLTKLLSLLHKISRILRSISVIFNIIDNITKY